MKEGRVFILPNLLRVQRLFRTAVVLLVVSGAATADPGGQNTPTTLIIRGGAASDLESVLKAVLTNNGQLREAAEDIEIARQQIERAKAAMYPRGHTTFFAAPIYEERGNAVSVVRNYHVWGPWLSTKTELIQPLFTFGQIGGYRKAAEHQLVATGELAKMKRNDVVATAKDFYYTFLMAADLEKLVDKLLEFLGEAVKKAEEGSNSGAKNTIKPHDLNRLKIAYDDLLQKKLYAKQGKQTAHKAVLWMTGNAFESVPDNVLEPEKFEKKTLDDYLKLARTYRPELKALVAGQVARNALADAKEAQNYPTLFLGGMLDLNWTPVRDGQMSFYAQDWFNRLQGGVALGLRLDLEFHRHNAEAAEERAQAMKLKATQSYATPGIELDVSRAYWELEQSMEGLDVADRRRKTGRKWFVGSAMGWSIGVTQPKEMLEALEGDGLSRQNYVQTLYLHNSALAKLSKAVGTEITYLKY